MVTFWLATSEEGTCPTLSRQSYADSVWGSARSSDDGYLGKGYQNQWGIICITSDEIAKFHQKREAWYADHRCSTPAGQCSSSQLTCCPDRSAILRLCNPSSPTVLSRPGTIWVPSLSNNDVIFKRQAILRRRNRHFRSKGMAASTICWVLQ